MSNITEHIKTLVPIFAAAAVGDFSKNLDIPPTEDEFTPLLVGIQIMLDVIREKMRGLQEDVEEKVAILQSIGDGVVVLDSHEIVTFLNPSGQELLGWTEAEVLGKQWFQIVPLESLDGTHMDITARPYQTLPGEQWFYRRKDGLRMNVSTTVAPFMNDGQKVGTIIVFRDVTKEKAVEQLKDDFLSLATHQLRNPLATMRWTMESLFASDFIELAPAVHEKLNVIYQHNLQMIQLVNDLLNVTRMDQKKVKDTLVTMCLGDVMKAVVKEYAFEAMRRQITVQVSFSSQELERRAYSLDEELLSHCVQNMLSNALKYSHDHSTVLVEIAEEAEKVCMSVADQGLGIPLSDQPHIFERFYRGKNVSELDIPGSGLGLYIVRSLAERWGGSVSFTSEENKGTKISMCLPLARVTM